MFCKHCGADIKDDHGEFCNNCGKRIEEETPKKKGSSKKYVVLLVTLVVLIIAAGGGYFVIHKMKEDKEIESFQKIVDQYKAVKDDYKLGSLKTDYKALLERSNVCIEDKKLSQIDTLTDDMDKMTSEIKKQDEQLKEYEGKMKTVKKTIEVYKMSTAKKADFNAIMDDYQDAIDQGNIEDCKEAEEKAQTFLKALVKENAKVKVKVKTKTKVVVKTVREKEKIIVHHHDRDQVDVPSYTENKSEFVFWDSDSRYLSVSELYGLSKWELCIARNEIYARRGRYYETPKLHDYFSGCSWYNGTIQMSDFSDSVFNRYEKANIKLIVSYEKSCGY